jgi:NADH:ubiquinone oxidoreductase subunit 4 (subunit M)
METRYLPSLLAWIIALTVFVLKSRAKTAKYVASAGCLASFVLTMFVNMSSLSDVLPMLFSILAALLCIASQRNENGGSISMALILFVLGLVYPALYGYPVLAKIAQVCFLLALVVLSFVFRKNPSLGFGSAAALTASAISLMLSSFVNGPCSAVLQLVAAASLLPLFPFHVGYIGLLNNLPGSLPAFLALISPVLGWHVLAQVPRLEPNITSVIVVLIVIEVLVTGLRAFVQAGLLRVIGAVGTLLLAPGWWIYASNGKLGAEGGAYILAVGLVVSGLSLCAHCLEARFGTQALESLPGLAKTMPKFAMAFILLIMAGLGIPIFAVFSSFMLLILSSLRSGAADLLFVCLVWLVCFGIQASILQRLLFRQPRSNLVYRDLSQAEALSLAVILLLLIVGGIFPKVIFNFIT